jgi:hypothetical protein
VPVKFWLWSKVSFDWILLKPCFVYATKNPVPKITCTTAIPSLMLGMLREGQGFLVRFVRASSIWRLRGRRRCFFGGLGRGRGRLISACVPLTGRWAGDWSGERVMCRSLLERGDPFAASEQLKIFDLFVAWSWSFWFERSPELQKCKYFYFVR